jgi:hypothetical protein
MPARFRIPRLLRLNSTRKPDQVRLFADKLVEARQFQCHDDVSRAVVLEIPAVYPGPRRRERAALRRASGFRIEHQVADAIDLRRDFTQANPAVGKYLGPLDWVTDAGWQQYHGLLLSAQRRAANGVTATANYTWSTCEGLINQGGGPLNLGTGYTHPQSLLNPPSAAESKALFELDKGRCADSRTHIANFSASAQAPQFESAAMRAIGSGWRLSVIFSALSGAVIDVSANADRSLTGVQNGTQRVNRTGADVYGDGTIDNFLNPAGFEQPALGTFGTSPRNGLTGPGRKVVNLSLVRAFRFGTQQIQARVEAFNVFNWNNWGDPVTAINNANFGRILTVGDPRIMQFAMKYSF